MRDEALPEPAPQALDWRYHLETDTRRIRRALGYRELVPREEAIERTVRWERATALVSARRPSG